MDPGLPYRLPLQHRRSLHLACRRRQLRPRQLSALRAGQVNAQEAVRGRGAAGAGAAADRKRHNVAWHRLSGEAREAQGFPGELLHIYADSDQQDGMLLLGWRLVLQKTAREP